MLKRKNIWIIVILCLIIGLYVVYKGFNLHYYNVTNIENHIRNLKLRETVTIKTESLDEDSYLKFNDIKIKNDFDNFTKLEENSTEETVKYVLRDEENETVASFWMGTTDLTYVDIFTTDLDMFKMSGSIFKEIDRTNLLSKRNITDDVELFEYLSKDKNTKNTIFTSVSNMKDHYAFEVVSSIAMPSLDISLIDGDYRGYIFNIGERTKEVNILKNNKRYVFTFIGLDYFTDEYISEILNTIVID